MEAPSAEGGGHDQQSLTDIQSYLANFNKEIGTDPSTGQTIFLSTGGDGTGGHGATLTFTSQDQLFATSPVGVESQAGHVDHGILPDTEQPPSAQPQTMLIQGPDGNPVQVLTSMPSSLQPMNTITSTANPQLVAVQGQGGAQPQLVAVQGQLTQAQLNQAQLNQAQFNAVAQGASAGGLVQQPLTMPVPGSVADGDPHGAGAIVTTQPQGAGDVGDGHQQSVVLNTGSSYQTVTIVPSEVNQGGEVSYVLIVSQPEDEKNADMSVYDFKEEKGTADTDAEEDMDEHGGPAPKKTVKQTPRKQGQVQTQLMCNYCNYTSPKRYLLTRHMKTHSEERPHKCHICDRGFKTVASLQNHINTHTGVRPHKCKECDAAFTTSGELVRHVRYRHTFEKPHKCSECDYCSVELSKLKRHMRSHTGERPYQCPHCSYASPDTYKLKRHLRIHTGEKPYECEVCHARFTQSNSLKAHRLIHTGAKPVYQCELCPTTCGRKTDLKIHVQKLHTADQPLSCKKCGKSFPDRYTYKIHVKTHEGEKCFKCELCPYAALSQRHLESHILTHTGEKPFQCDECDQTFRQKQLLKRHKNLYHTADYVAPPTKDKMHECGECHKTFAHKGNLLRHMAIHDPDNPMYSEQLDDEDAEEDMGHEQQTVSYIQDSEGNYVQLVSPDGTQTGQIVVQIDGNQQTISMPQLQAQLDNGSVQVIQQHNMNNTMNRSMDEDDEDMEEEEEEEEEDGDLPLPPSGIMPQVPTTRVISTSSVGGAGVQQMVIMPQGKTEAYHGASFGNRQLTTNEMVEVLQTGQAEEEDEEEEEEDGDEVLTSELDTSGSTSSPRKSPRKPKAIPVPIEQKKKNIETCFGFEDME